MMHTTASKHVSSTLQPQLEMTIDQAVMLNMDSVSFYALQQYILKQTDNHINIF